MRSPMPVTATPVVRMRFVDANIGRRHTLRDIPAAKVGRRDVAEGVGEGQQQQQQRSYYDDARC